jgi:hypothetical protein
VAGVENINIMCTPGYPTSGGTAASAVNRVHEPKAVTYQRARFVTTGVTVPQTADLPSDMSAKTSELRT